MSFPYFLAYLLPLIALIVGEIAFVCLFCRKQRPRLRKDDVLGWCWLITIGFAIADFFITANRTEVWVIESKDIYSHKYAHKYVISRTGEYANVGKEDYYVINNSDGPIYYAEIHYSTISNNVVVKPIAPGTIMQMDRSIDNLFKTPPSSIRVERGTRYFILNALQASDLWGSPKTRLRFY